MENKLLIKKMSTDLLNEKISGSYAEEVIQKINNCFQELTEITGKEADLEHLACLPGEVGVALSLTHAATCLLDFIRTTKFLRGFVAAIKDKQKKHPNETIQVFYAGCGPFAPFVTMVAPLFTPEEIQFSLLEINEKSLDTAKKLIDKLELSEYVKEYHLADAITFQIPNPEKIHILFSETLDSLLYRECYVPILWNLLPQLSEDATIIPENVLVKMNFKIDEKETFEATVFDTRKTLATNKKTSVIPEKFPSTIISLENARKYYSIVLDTEVQIYKETKLWRSESSLTLALEIPIEKPVIHESVAFTYFLKPQPELQFTVQ